MRTAPVRRLLIDPTRPRRDGRSSRSPGRPIGGRWLAWLVVVAGLAAPSGLRAQTATEPTPLSRYIPKENLLFYFEFSGLDAHAATWNKTAAYRLLMDTPLGVMLEAVAGQLLDKALSNVANNKVSGAECVTLIKHVAHHGFAGGFRVVGKGGDSATTPEFHGALVFRGASTKEMRSISSRAMGWMMGGPSKARIDQREGRRMVVVSRPAPGQEGKEISWAWWPEKDVDLVLSTGFPAGVESVLASVDGKIPGATDHPSVKELTKPEADFDAVCIAFLDIANCPKTSNKLTEAIGKIGEAGIQRIDYRWGFDDDALKTITRLIAPKPRKPMLALFDQPGFAKMALLPMPEGVESFLELSISPNQLLDTIGEFGPEIKGNIEEFAETVENSGRIDLRKDLLAHLGPRIVLFVAPGRSAAATNESFETSWLQGFNPAKALAALQTIPKITLVAEVDDPIKFGKSLDGAIIAMNKALSVQALLKSEEEPEAKPDQGGAGANAGRAPGGRQGGAQGKRAPRRRSADTTPAPKFEAMAGDMKAEARSDVKAYLLRTPSDSALRLGPPGFRPVIKLDGKYLAISIVADGADAALKAVKRKDWKPSDDVQRACERLPAKIVMLGVVDPREILPTFLASLPASLQTMINSVAIVRGRMRAGGGNVAGGTNQQNRPGGMGMMAPGMPQGAAPAMGPGSRGRMMSGAPGGPGAPGGAPAAGGNNPPSPGDGTIELKVDADKLPQAEAIRSRLFLTTVSIDVTDQEIRLVTRKAFPNLFNWSVSGLSSTFSAQNQIEQAGNAGQEPGAGGGPTPPAGPGQGPGGMAPPGGRRGAGGGGAPGRPGGRRGAGAGGGAPGEG
jgi:hypothetical protein